MKFVHWFLALMFFVFALLQINDPDPVIWILVYACMVITCLLAAFGKFYRNGLYTLIVFYLIYNLLNIPGVITWFHSENRSELFSDLAKMQYPYIEETREFLGLMICVGVLAVYLYQSKRKNVS